MVSVLRSASVLGFALAALSNGLAPSGAMASPAPVYNQGVQQDCTTGDNFIAGEGWYVDPGCDSYVNDPTRERPLQNSAQFPAGGEWVNQGAYRADLDIETAAFGYDNQYLYFRMTQYGKGFNASADDPRDFGAFASGTLYNILLNVTPDPPTPAGEANGGIILSVMGDKQELWTGPLGSFGTLSNTGFWDENADVGGNGITITKEDGELAGNGWETKIVADGHIEGVSPNQDVLFARIAPGANDLAAKPVIEIAFDYVLWNAMVAADPGLGPSISPNAIHFLVFEANRGVKPEANYLWNDKWTRSEEGSPYNIANENNVLMEQMVNVYELDRYHWVIPEPGSLPLLIGGLAAMGLWRRGRQN